MDDTMQGPGAAAASRFAERYKAAGGSLGLDVEAVRLRQARRRSASQKENRQRRMSRSRRLEPPLVEEREAERPQAEQSSRTAVSSSNYRLEMLHRYKEDKLLRKLKEERAKPKQVFKVGIYRPDVITFLDLKPLSQNAVKPKPKAKSVVSSTADLRVTRSMSKKPEPLMTKAPSAPRFPAPAKAGPVKDKVATSRGGSTVVTAGTRNQHQAFQPAGPNVPAAREKRAVQAAAVKPPQTRGRAEPKSAPRALGPVQVTKPQMANSRTRKPGKTGEKSNCKPVAVDKLASAPCREQEMEIIPEREVQPLSSEELIAPTESEEGHQIPPRTPVLHVGRAGKKVSFAPENYVFAPMDGLAPFKFNPLSPRSVDGFFASHTWSPIVRKSKSNFGSPTAVTSVTRTLRNRIAPKIESESLPEPTREDPVSTVVEVPTLDKPQDSFASCTADVSGPVHDVAYFRGIIVSETANLTGLCQQWEGWANADEVPDGVKDLLRTTVGQARLLMAERFKQFNGLVDNCEFKTSEKEVTSTDLEGFWDMVYFQVEDVNKKFERLKVLQENSWQELNVLPPLPKKVATKKAAMPKPTEGLVIKTSKAPAPSRLAALKAAMKAKLKQEMTDSSNKESRNDDVIVFDAGFFRVESPAKSFAKICSTHIHSESPKTCPTIDQASRQQLKEQCPATESSVHNSTAPTSPVPCMADGPTQQTSGNPNNLPETESPAMMINVISSMAGERTAQEAACSEKSTEELSTSPDFTKYLQPRSHVRDSPKFHDDESDAKRDSTHDDGMSGLPASPLACEDVEMKSPASERTSPTGAHPIPQEEMLRLANSSSLMTTGSISAALKTPSSNSVGDTLGMGATPNSVQPTGNWMSPFETVMKREAQPVLPHQVTLQDLISFSPSGTPQ
uniref:disks large-associated protein 5 n=1 Tax=Pristiophorus japonicus TaxID=55135 RepID=UPI00398EED88